MGEGALGKALKALWLALVLFGVGSGAWLINDGVRLERTHQQDTKERADDYAYRAHVAVKTRCSPLAPAEELQCIREENNAARDGAYSENDLKAQLVSSVWTRQMGIAAIIAMAVGIVGVGLVYVTFQQTRRTADEAKRSADEAKRSADAFINAERPHLMVRTQGFGAKPGEPTMAIGIRLDNYGASPAVLTRLEWVLAADKKYPGPQFAGATTIKFVAHPTLEPGGINRGSNIQPRQQPGFIAGRLLYRSKFAPDHVTHFLWEVVQLENNKLGLKMRQPSEKNGWPKDA